MCIYLDVQLTSLDTASAAAAASSSQWHVLS